MGLLSDRQIRERCTPPKFMVTELVSDLSTGLVFDGTFSLREVTRFSTQSEEELQARMQARSSLVETFAGLEPSERMQPMGLKSYRPVTEEDLANWRPMIAPFEPRQIHEVTRDEGVVEKWKVISYGLSSYGYDIRCSGKFKIFTNVNSEVVDPKNFSGRCFVDVEVEHGDYVTIPPNSFALAQTLEYFHIPRDILTVCLGKSTYARCGIVVNVTPFEPEWHGDVTLEFSNTTPLPARIYAGEGCAQVLFFKGDEVCETSYADRKNGLGGKFQGQKGITLPKV